MEVLSRFLVQVWILTFSIPGLLVAQNDLANQSEFIIECGDLILLSDLYAKAEMPIYRLQGKSVAKVVIDNIKYPSTAKEYKNSGFVKVFFRVNTEGKVSKFKVLESSNNIFDSSALSG
ncbi:MAG: energy transducer TonB, partial [Flavobacteriales bacterium]